MDYTYMKTKLTLTIDSGISHRAKSLARKRGSSLSQMVEDLLADQMGPTVREPKKKPFSERWAGRMKLSGKNDLRSRRLKRKYGIEEPK